MGHVTHIELWKVNAYFAVTEDDKVSYAGIENRGYHASLSCSVGHGGFGPSGYLRPKEMKVWLNDLPSEILDQISYPQAS